MISNIHHPKTSREMLASNELQQKIIQLLLTDTSTKDIVQFSYNSILDKVQKFLRSLFEERSAEPLIDEKDEQQLRQRGMNMETESEKGEDEILNQGGKGKKDDSGKAFPSNIIEPSREAQFMKLVNKSPSKEKNVAKLEHHQSNNKANHSSHKVSFNIDKYLKTLNQKELKFEYTKQLILKNFEADEKPSKKHERIGRKLQKQKNVINLIDESEKIQEERNVLTKFIQNKREEDVQKLKNIAKIEFKKEQNLRNSNARPDKRTDPYGISKKKKEKIVIEIEEDDEEKYYGEKIEQSFQRKQPFQQNNKNDIKKRQVYYSQPRYPRIDEKVAQIILELNEKGRIPQSYEVKKWAKEKANEFYPSQYFSASLSWLKGFSQRNPNIKFEINSKRQPKQETFKSEISEYIENFKEKQSVSIEIESEIPEDKHYEMKKKKKIIEKSPIITRRLLKLKQQREKNRLS